MKLTTSTKVHTPMPPKKTTEKTTASRLSPIKRKAQFFLAGIATLGLLACCAKKDSNDNRRPIVPEVPSPTTFIETEDCANSGQTACDLGTVGAGGIIFNGSVGADDTADWIGVSLSANTTYSITIAPGTLALNASTNGTSANANIGDDALYTPNTSQTYIIVLGADTVANYSLSIIAQPNANPVNDCNSMDAEADCDSDGISNSQDDFDYNACASVDADDDGFPAMDEIKTVGTPGAPSACDSMQLLQLMMQIDNCPVVDNVDQINTDGDMEGDACDIDDDNDSVLDVNAIIAVGTTVFNGMTVTDNTPRDEFPLDRTRSCTIVVRGSGANHESTTINCDNDAVTNNIDVDDDNDGLIELATEDELHNMRWDLDGSHYDQSEDASTNETDGSNMGCPSSGCNGYELINNVSLTAGGRANWENIGSDSNPFNAIFDGNGYGISGMAIANQNISLIGFLSSATTRNLHIAGSINHTNASHSASVIGGIAGGRSRIYNSGSSVAIISTVAYNGALRASIGIGGLLGSISDSTMLNSWSSGNISVTPASGDGYSIGGLIGTDDLFSGQD